MPFCGITFLDLLQVNILIHRYDFGKDKVVYQYPFTYDKALPRVDLLWKRTKDGFGHVDVLSDKRSTYIRE